MFGGGFWFLLLVPDFSMIGYVFGNKVRSFCYNLLHHRGIAIVIYLFGIYFSNELNSTHGNYFIRTFSDG